MRRLTLALAASVLLLTGCSSDGSDGSNGSDGSDGGSADPGSSSGSPDDPETSAAPDGAGCADIWVAGETLPDDYTGCGGPETSVECEDGSALISYDDIMFAVPGGTIVEPEAAPMQDTEEYGVAFDECVGVQG